MQTFISLSPVLAVISILVTLGITGWFVKFAFIDGEDEIDIYQGFFKYIAASLIIAFIAAAIGLVGGFGWPRTLSFISIAIMFILFVAYFVRANQIKNQR